MTKPTVPHSELAQRRRERRIAAARARVDKKLKRRGQVQDELVAAGMLTREDVRVLRVDGVTRLIQGHD